MEDTKTVTFGDLSQIKAGHIFDEEQGCFVEVRDEEDQDAAKLLLDVEKLARAKACLRKKKLKKKRKKQMASKARKLNTRKK